MSDDALQKLLEELNHSAIPLEDRGEDYAAVIKQIGAARFVMIGEASHGTHEFYQARINVSQRLIKEHGFMAIAIEGDWPDVYRVHRYLQGDGNANQSECSLAAFKRFPTWMWRNTTLPPFLEWLRKHNDDLPPAQKSDFTG